MARTANGESAKGRGRKVGYAVVGLGHIAQVAVLPAFAHARRARLAALVSGHSKKRKELAQRYAVDVYRYEELAECLAREDVDAVYVALPNTLHARCAIEAARAGAHVLVEKPMATSEEDCRAMIRACDDAGVKLMVAYRLHFEPANLGAVEVAASGRLGEPRFFASEFSYQVKPGNIRTEGPLGGGALWDLGIYCINAARYLFRAEPTEAMAMAARAQDRRLKGVDEGWTALLRFPGDALASFTCSFNAAVTGRYRLVGTRGQVALDPAYEYVGELERTLTIGDRVKRRRYPQRDQFAPELDELARCVLEDDEPEPSGEEGLADVRIIEAILRSAREGRAISIEPVARRRRPGLGQLARRPSVRAPPPAVDAEAPSQG